MKKTLDEIRQYINEGLYDPGIFKVFFLAGGPGSGKTFVTSSAFAGTGLKLVNSDRFLEKGDYIRMRNVTFSYTFPKAKLDKVPFNSLRIYIQGQNLLTFTEFTLDPEQAIQGTSFFVYPNSKTLSFGVDLKF